MYIYIVQEKCARGDLFKELERKGGTMEESRVCMEVAVPLLLTLRHLHQRAIVHRDIKPENIFFTGNNELKLGDFGLAVDLEKERPVSRVGTLDYMAPEVLASPTPEQIARNAAEASSGYGAKVDVWALGVLVYELVAGRPPFEVQDHDQTALLIMHANLEHFPPQISKHCASFILQALAKKPSERPSAEELLQHPWIRQHYLVDCPVELKPYLHPWSHGREVGFQGGPQAEPRQPLRTGRSLDYRPSQLSDDALEASSSGQQGGKALVEDLSDIRIGPIAAKPPRRLGLVSNKVCKQPQPSLLFGARRGARPGRLAKEEWLDRARRFSCPGGVASPVVLDAAKNGKAAPQHILGKRWDADLGGSGTSGSSAAAPPKPPDDSNGGGSGGPQGGQQFLDGKLLAEWRAQQSQAIHCHTEGRRPQKDASSVTVPVLRSVPLQSPLASPSNPVKAADRQKTSRFAQQALLQEQTSHDGSLGTAESPWVIVLCQRDGEGSSPSWSNPKQIEGSSIWYSIGIRSQGRHSAP
eukprot:CAMPEP_0177614348 /NCGR_PEP_ID=MMETSP0419_2-20121207/22639_1 /TAXON_ID=582737 /ORGANISM="Tetraselmis sp., Strain GSL018" /LENGTH=525 /DNA_ID=CAMNT_0019111463 /DNA_START=896 /DNA_END=2474 /DNA_ORIENTATION=-